MNCWGLLMNSDEIKATYSMQDILARYGLIPNRAKFIQCPFHYGDREPSMKIYKDSFHCFGCGASGDIFVFVERMENLTFKEAYRLLGGTYDRDGGRSQIKASTLRKIQLERKKRQRKIQREKTEMHRAKNLAMRIAALRILLKNSEPLSDDWTFYYNKLEYCLYLDEAMEGGETRGGWNITARYRMLERHRHGEAGVSGLKK